MSGTELTGLIAPEALASRLGDERLVILDIRYGDGAQEAFEAGHIPGSLHSDYAADGWRHRIGDAPGMLPPVAYLSELLGRLGIGPRDDVVIVPAGETVLDLAAATRIYWTLKLVGHDRQAVLDGGLKGWRADPARPVAQGPSQPRPTAAYPVVQRQELRSTTDATLLAARGKTANLLDARSPSYFEGRQKAPQAARAGHIPGAMALDFALAFDAATGRLKPMDELTALFRKVPAGPVVTYCNTGHSAALNWFVLSELMGREEVALYDGSMTDWTQDPEREVATGPA